MSAPKNTGAETVDEEGAVGGDQQNPSTQGKIELLLCEFINRTIRLIN